VTGFHVVQARPELPAGGKGGQASRARREYVAWRARQIAYGRWAPWAPAEPVREHVRRLRQIGCSYRGIAQAAGVSAATVCGLVGGEPSRGRPAPGRIRAGHASRLLAVTAGHISRGRRSAAGARLRLRALVAMGHAPPALARQLGAPAGRVGRVISGEARTVTPGMHAAVCGLYERLWDRRPPERTRQERLAASAARRRAARHNWPLAMALDDDRLDDPSYRPKAKWRPLADPDSMPVWHFRPRQSPARVAQRRVATAAQPPS
jgi:hypothetical protein